MIDLKSVIKTGIIPTDLQELQSSFGDDYSIIPLLIQPADRRNIKNYIYSLIDTGNMLADLNRHYQAAICYAFAATFGNKQAYQRLMTLIKLNNILPNQGDPRLSRIPLALCEEKLYEINSKTNAAPPLPKIRVMKPPQQIKFKMPLIENIDPELKELIEKTKSPIILAKKMDLMYEILLKTTTLLTKIYLNKNRQQNLLEIRHSASQFLCMVLNVSDESQIPRLMAERFAARRYNPEFIPGIKPKISNLPPHYLPENSNSETQASWRSLSELTYNMKEKKILPVTNTGRQSDVYAGTKFLSPEERSLYRLIIKDGRFYHQSNADTFSLFDTRNSVSHKKISFISFTINMQGEMSAFNHYDMSEGKDPFAHSSTNAGRAVLAAGEIQLINGFLANLTAHSGHYKPDALNVYYALHYFKEKAVDTSHTYIYFLFKLPDELGLGMMEEPAANEVLFRYEADDFYQKFHAKLAKELEEKKVEERAGLITEITEVMVNKRKTQLLDKLEDLCSTIPLLSKKLNPLIAKVKLIESNKLGASKKISQINGGLLPLIKNDIFEYTWYLTENAEKYANITSRSSGNNLREILDKIKTLDLSSKHQTNTIDEIKSYYTTAVAENHKMNQELKKYINLLLTDLTLDIKACLKQPRKILIFFPSSTNKCALHYILDNLESLKKQLKKIDANKSESFPRLDQHFDDFLKIFQQFHMAAADAGIEANIHSRPDLTTKVAWWKDRLNLSDSIEPSPQNQ